MGIIEGKFGEVDYGKINIIAQTENRLSEHSKDDTYVITKDVELCCDILDKYKTLIIIAKAGGGKTKTSIQIATMYQEKMYKPMLFVNDKVARKRELINFNEKNIIIVEDLFGRSNIDFNEDLHRGILDVLHSSLKSESCQSKLIFTIRGNAEINLKLNERHNIFEKDIFINLDENRSLDCNELILSKHMTKHGISLCKSRQLTTLRAYVFPSERHQQCKSDVLETNDNSLQICVSLLDEICSEKYEMHIGFPQASHLFCSNKNFTKQGISYFKHASQSLVNEIMNLKTQGSDNKQIQYQYCALVYTAIKRSINMDDIDEDCFKNILSYFESYKIRMSLLKEAVFKLKGTYFNQKSSDSACNHFKRQKVSDIYALQHSTIREAILVTYGDDNDILSLCDSWFLFEYIRPKGYKFSPSDHMVYHFTDYKLLAKRLMSILSTGYYTCICVGAYLQNMALFQRHDEIIQFFFEIIEDVRPEQYVCLLNGLTSLGTNTDLVRFHPQLCKKIMKNGGWIVFLASCRPIGWSDNDTNFLEIDTDMLIEKLVFMIALNRFNGDDLNPEENEKKYHPLSLLSKFLNYQYAVGNYVFENLIAKGFVDIAKALFTKIKHKEQEFRPIHIKEFLDGLLHEGKRSWIVSQFKEFFEAVLNKYGSIPIILQLCRPLTANISNPNIIQVDDSLLIGKLSAHLESSFGNISDLKQTVPRENGAYFVHRDFNYLQMQHIKEIAEFIAELGVKVNNDKFVRTMFEQLITDIPDIFYAGSSSDDEKSEDDDADDLVPVATKIAFDDYPDDELGEDENGSVVYFDVKVGYVRRVYQDILFGSTYHRLFEFLSSLSVQWILNQDSKYKRMTILWYKFEYILDVTREVDVCRHFDSDESYYSDSSE